MKQHATAKFYGVVSFLRVKQTHVHVMLIVNQSNRHGHQTGSSAFNVYLFDTAFSTHGSKIRVGDFLYLENVEMEVEPTDKIIFFRVKYSTDVLLVAGSNRQTILQRYSDSFNEDLQEIPHD